MRSEPTLLLALGAAFALSGCGSDTGEPPSSTESGGSLGSGGGGDVTGTGGSSGLATGGVANPTGGSATGGATATGGTTAQPEAFEVQGTWLYLGPWDGVHTLEISNGSIAYADVAGEWSSSFTITEYDNSLDRFQLVFESGTGTYYPPGPNVSASYVLSGEILTIQLAPDLGSYPLVQSPGSCTDEGSERIRDCGLYMHRN
ncbi:MAG: hypothetical protein JW751_29940 [Polyangiaceae bacterium]|nr:hypothetical protein [Polyangiaceae bacterium]